MGTDGLLQWAKQHRTVFETPDSTQLEMTKEILSKFPNLIDPSKETPEADPFVVALARFESQRRLDSLLPASCIVVTEERGRPNRVPDVCAHYGLKCIRLMDLFRNEGWRF
jgi:hypothetical protein